MECIESNDGDLAELLAQVERAFAPVRPPEWLQDIETQNQFEDAFMGPELQNTIDHLYDYSEDEVHYLTPFLIRSYLYHYGKEVSTDSVLSEYLYWFRGFCKEEPFIRQRYLSFYSRFDANQKQAVCMFLAFLLKHNMDEGEIDPEMLEYWCADGPQDLSAGIRRE